MSATMIVIDFGGSHMTIKKHIAVALLTFASLVPVSSTAAQSADPFEVFPESCASGAREQVEEDRARAQPSVGYAFYDRDGFAPDAVATLDGKASQLLDRAGKLLLRGMTNSVRPRLSSERVREAQRIGRLWDLYGPSIQFVKLGGATLSKTASTYMCLTDTCPTGAECRIIDLEKHGEQLKAALPAHRKVFNRIVAWANKVPSFRSKVPRLTREYNRVEAEIPLQINAMPPQLAIIVVRVPFK
jgi:hypothetical protein